MTIRARVIAGLWAAGVLLAARGARAETFEQSCRFAEALGDRLRSPDLGLAYLESLQAQKRIPADREGDYARAVLTLLEIQLRQTPEPAKREALVKRAREMGQGVVDRIVAGSSKTPPAAAEFRLALAYLRILQAGCKDAGDAGGRLKDLHALTLRLYRVLDGATLADDNEKLDLMVEYLMTDGATVLSMRGALAADKPALLEALKQGAEGFGTVRYVFDDPEHPDLVGFPNAHRGQAQCYRGISEASADPAAAKKAMDEAKKLLNAVLNNPINEAVSPADADEARYVAAKDLLDIAFSARPPGLPEADKVVADFNAKARQRPALRSRAALLAARVDMAKAQGLKPTEPRAAELRAKAIAAATKVREDGGSAAPEAEALLGEWEGLTGRAQKNWKAEADRALEAKGYEEAVRKFRAAARNAGAGRDDLKGKSWAGIGQALAEQKRFLEASLAFERAAGLLSGPVGGTFAAASLGSLQEGVKAYPLEASAQHKAALRFLATRFPDHPKAPMAAFILADQLLGERDYENAARYLQTLQPGFTGFVEAQYLLARCRLGMLRRLERDGKPADPALRQAADQALSAFLDQARAKPELRKRLAEAAYQRIELHVLPEPAKALEWIQGYAAEHPDAKERHAELPRLRALALAAKGDWGAAARDWEALVAAAGDKKPWPLLGEARTLHRLCGAAKGVREADTLGVTLSNQIAVRQQFRFSEAAQRFQTNYKERRYADAIVAGEQIRENVEGTKAAEDPENRKWLAWFREALPECYVETAAWSRAVEFLTEQQDDARIRIGDKAGEMPPPLPSAYRVLWERTALACTRAAEQMPAGEARKALALRAAESWTRLLDALGVADPQYWPMVLDCARAEVLAGKYAAARDRVHGSWLTYRDLGGLKDRFIEAIKDLKGKEPAFGEPYARTLLDELEGAAAPGEAQP